jgi:hypothetical protein
MSSTSSGVRSSERRRFLKLVGFAGLSTAVGSAMSAFAEPRPPRGGRRPAPPRAAPVIASPESAAAAPDTSRGAGKPPEISEDARALAAVLKRRYGAHLDDKQLQAVTEEIEFRLQGGKRLRDRKLANSDEPDFTFKA